MSYEGFYQCICKAQHYWESDCMFFSEPEVQICPVEKCKEKVVWWNLVDTTNGTFYDHPDTGERERIDGYVEVDLDHNVTCEHCHSILESVFRIPKDEGHRTI
jgi:hypothetical protein